MRIEIDEEGNFLLKEVYTSIVLKAYANASVFSETFAICMRDCGFEFKYGGNWYEAKRGFVSMMPGSGGDDEP